MIPIRLTIKGLYSYREQVEIDFERLGEGHLFGIFGAVGSGKSAILEAITFALYGRTERLNLSGDNRNYNMMNLQSQEMLIELEFRTVANGAEERYLFRVRQSRNSKRFEDVKSPSRSAMVWRQGQWEPLPNTDATELLRLSYENFVKTIIIPQGKFQEFLHMGATDRARMLREIFALDRFELDRPTKELMAATKEQSVRLEEQLATLAAANPDEIARQKADADALAATVAETRAQVDLATQSVNLLRQLKQLSEEIAVHRASLAALEQQQPAFARRAEALAQYQQARLEFGELLGATDRLQREVQAAKQAHDEADARVAKLTPELEAARLAAAEAKQAWEGRSQLETQIQDLGHWIAVNQTQAKLHDVVQRIAKGSQLHADAERESIARQSALEALDAEIATLKRDMPDLDRLGELRLWHQQRQHLEDQAAQQSKAVGELGQDIAGIWAEMQAAAGREGDAPATLLQAAEAAVDRAKEAVADARAAQVRLSHQSGLASYALDLQDGQPCPLCGAEHHPQPYDPGQTQALVDAAAASLAAAEAAAADHERALQALQRLATRHEEKLSQRQAAQRQWEAQKAAAAQHLAAFHWPQYAPDRPEAVEAEREAALRAKQALAHKEAERRAVEQALRDGADKLRAYADRLSQLQQEQSSLQAQRDTRKAQITTLLSEAEASKDEAALQHDIRRLKERLTLLQQASEQTEKAQQRIEIELAEWKQRLALAAVTRDRLQAEHGTAQAMLDQRLASSAFGNIAVLREVLGRQVDVTAEQAAIRAFEEQMTTQRATVMALEARAQAQRYDAEAHAAAEAALAEANGRMAQQQEQLSLLRNAIQRTEADWLRRQDLEAKAAQVRAREENLRLLEGLFKASGFVKYVSTIYLQELLTRADVRFRQLTRNALSLELGDENDFLVRDMLNGGQTRSVKTLSGGQTFQASLCLALALAENVQQRSGSSHNFFFLDEGFGTLDKDSLGTVFDALKQLRAENRIVGVISHVEDLQQEIDLHLKVWQTEERGSWVKGSWE